METAPTPPKRRTRADAARNHDRLVAAAKAVFARDGAAATLDAVAREAALGIGTLYRHFPTREALYEAVYRRDIAQLVDLGAQRGGDEDPVEDLRHWLHAMPRHASVSGLIPRFEQESLYPASRSFRRGAETGSVGRIITFSFGCHYLSPLPQLPQETKYIW